MSRLEVLDWASARANPSNEDIFGSCGRWAWIADGASGLAGTPYTPGPSDAAWLVEQIDAAIASMPAELSARGWAKAMETGVANAFLPYRKAGAETPLRYPAAALAAIRLNGSSIEALNIGDCAVVLRNGFGAAERLGTSRVERFDRCVESILRRSQAKGGSYEDAWPAMQARIARNRAKANRAGGYWVVRPDSRWARHTQVRRRKVGPGSRILLATDGFMRLTDAYRRYPTPDSLLEACRAGLVPLLAELRAIEADDSGCARYPRIKPSDDATALLLEVSHGR